MDRKLIEKRAETDCGFAVCERMRMEVLPAAAGVAFALDGLPAEVRFSALIEALCQEIAVMTDDPEAAGHAAGSALVTMRIRVPFLMYNRAEEAPVRETRHGLH
tara:strand:+ start:1065 stop:1376 length:312 start_codon:yes stop_codon:yes gene_type:complete